MGWQRPLGMRGGRGREVEASAKEGKGDQRRESGRERGGRALPKGGQVTVFRTWGPITAHFQGYPNRQKGLESGAVKHLAKDVR